MNWLHLLLLAAVQGLTEFIPVSSSGHLLAARFFFHIPDVEGTAFDAFLHLGTLTAVLGYYWRVWWRMIKALVSPDQDNQDDRQLVAKLAIATVPAAIVGYLFQDTVGEFFRTPIFLALFLLFTALILWVFDHISIKANTIKRAGFSDAGLIGLFQILALLPGVSRSGVTIAAGRWRGLSRKQAAAFSFLMSAPIIAGAGLSALSELLSITDFSAPQLIAAFLVSCLSGLIAIHYFIKIIIKVSFTPFVVYLIVLAGIILIYV